ncbi:hypothetical protein, partial [Azohydromonas lata]
MDKQVRRRSLRGFHKTSPTGLAVAQAAYFVSAYSRMLTTPSEPRHNLWLRCSKVLRLKSQNKIGSAKKTQKIA